MQPHPNEVPEPSSKKSKTDKGSNSSAQREGENSTIQNDVTKSSGVAISSNNINDNDEDQPLVKVRQEKVRTLF